MKSLLKAFKEKNPVIMKRGAVTWKSALKKCKGDNKKEILQNLFCCSLCLSTCILFFAIFNQSWPLTSIRMKVLKSEDL